MVDFIIKKDGSKESFDREKIKNGVLSAAKQSGLAQNEAEELAARVADYVEESTAGISEILAADVREKIVSFLDNSAPNVEGSWKNYESSKR